ncbi:MAG TPA: acetate--CoA ligase family protein, partial [Pseudonocardiaceae bacterium]
GLGLSTFISAGNRADLSGNDMLQYWQTDPDTDVVLLHFETFGNPRKFARVARRLARTKPIVAVKSGRHVGLMQGLAEVSVPVDEASVAVLFEQTGVIRVESLAQLFDTALLLANQPLPAGPRVAVVGNSSALGVLVADAALANGLTMPAEPVDTGATAPPDAFAAAVRDTVTRKDVDALVAVFVPPVQTPGAPYAAALRAAVAGCGKPVLSTFLATEGIPAELSVPGPDGTPGYGSVPSYPSPERAVLALARVVRYAAWRAAPVGEFVTPDGMALDAARELIDAVLAEGPDGRELTDEEAVRLLDAAAVPVVPFRRASTADDAVAAADELGYPVVLKAIGEPWRHRPDLVGVRLDLPGPDGVHTAYAELTELSGSPTVYVQRMAPKGVATAFELADDPSFGSLLSFGLHGMLGDLLGDRAYRALPLSDNDAAALIRAPRAAPLLTGYRGATPVDLDALADVALRLSRLAEREPWIRRLSLQPVLASPSGAFVAGAHVVVGPQPARFDEGPRRLN